MIKKTFYDLVLQLTLVLSFCNLLSCNHAGKAKTVLILGNSIVRHHPSPEIGWNGDWGMAASVIDSDFVHRLVRHIKEIDPSAIIVYKNIGDFERSFPSYSFNALQEVKKNDLVILKIAENVDDKKAMDSNFIFYYDKLLNFIDPGKRANKIIVDGFWENSVVNKQLKEYASKNNYPFISITDLSKDSSNLAIGRYRNKGVANHPSDKGMRLIEERIWIVTKLFFSK